MLLLACAGNPKHDAGKVVSLVPSVTEIIFALGQERQLAGNTTFCDYPEAAKQVYKVGDFSNPSVEKIVALKPGLVFATLPEQQASVEKLTQLGIKVFISRPNSLDSMLKEIVAIGRVLGVQARGESLAASLRQRLARIADGDTMRNRVPLDSPRVYLEISEQPLMTVGKSSFVNEAIERAGGANIFGDVAKEYPVVTQEQVIERNPEVIFIFHPQTTRKELAQRLGWQSVAAVKAKRTYDDVNQDLLFRPGPRLVDGIEQLASRMWEPAPTQQP
jgi:iron complex transport system substrate-binding protein